jgi:hypothetical protein
MLTRHSQPAPHAASILKEHAAKPQPRAAKLCCIPFRFTSAAFYAEALALSTVRGATCAYAFTGKQLQRRGNMSARVCRDRSPRRKQGHITQPLLALRAAIQGGLTRFAEPSTNDMIIFT